MRRNYTLDSSMSGLLTSENSTFFVSMEKIKSLTDERHSNALDSALCAHSVRRKNASVYQPWVQQPYVVT